MFKEFVIPAIRSASFTKPGLNARWDSELRVWVIGDEGSYLKISYRGVDSVLLELVNTSYPTLSISRIVPLKNVSSELSKWFRDRI